jgi:hypothetical protein
MVNTKKMKGLIFAKKSIAQIRRPVVWLRSFHPLRRIPKPGMASFSNLMPSTGLNLNVMSFNIRRGTAKDGKNHWRFRRNRICELLNHYHPDVLGLQEALNFQISEICTMLPGYENAGTENWGGSKALHNAIFFNASRFRLSEQGTSSRDHVHGRTWLKKTRSRLFIFIISIWIIFPGVRGKTASFF